MPKPGNDSDLVAIHDFGTALDQGYQPGPFKFAFTSKDPRILLTGQLAGKPEDGVPRPSYVTNDRPGSTGIVQYTGSEPREQIIPIKFDGSGDPIEGRLHTLYELMRPTARDNKPPIIRASGDGVMHQTFEWRIVGADVDHDRTLYVPGTGIRRFWTARVTLRQQVQENLLDESLKAFNRGGKGEGIRPRYYTVKVGERTLYDVAKHALGDPSAAREIAIANPGTFLSTRLRAGQKLRLP